jgi:hypothetical protein
VGGHVQEGDGARLAVRSTPGRTEGRHREAGALLDARVRARSPEQAARTAATDPRRLVPLLLATARGVSDERYRDVPHALRVAGHAA